MDPFQNINPDIVNWVIVPLFIFVARILDVSVGTVRIITVGKGLKGISALLGFVEVIIWLLALSQIMQNLTHFAYYIAYAGGFATGNYMGVFIEGKLSIGKVVLRIVTKRDATDLLEYLIARDYHLTTVDAEGRIGKVTIVYMVLERKKLKELLYIINRFNPKAFYTIEDVRFANDIKSIKRMGPRFKKPRVLKKVFAHKK